MRYTKNAEPKAPRFFFAKETVFRILTARFYCYINAAMQNKQKNMRRVMLKVLAPQAQPQKPSCHNKTSQECGSLVKAWQGAMLKCVGDNTEKMAKTLQSILDHSEYKHSACIVSVYKHVGVVAVEAPKEQVADVVKLLSAQPGMKPYPQSALAELRAPGGK